MEEMLRQSRLKAEAYSRDLAAWEVGFNIGARYSAHSVQCSNPLLRRTQRLCSLANSDSPRQSARVSTNCPHAKVDVLAHLCASLP